MSRHIAGGSMLAVLSGVLLWSMTTVLPAEVAAPSQTTTTESSQDADAIVRDMSGAMEGVRSYHFVIDGPSTTEVGDVSLPGSIHVKTISSSDETELIVVGGQAYYRRVGDTGWTVRAVPEGARMESTLGQFWERATVQLIGSEVLKGVDMHHLRYSVAGEGRMPELTGEMWVGKSDKYMYKFTVDAEASVIEMAPGSQPRSRGTSTVHYEASFSRFNEPIEIKAPE